LPGRTESTDEIASHEFVLAPTWIALCFPLIVLSSMCVEGERRNTELSSRFARKILQVKNEKRPKEVKCVDKMVDEVMFALSYDAMTMIIAIQMKINHIH
jgi:hypothetical protein